MKNSRNLEPAALITLADVYFVVFRHKWKIVVLTAIGLVAAAVYFFMKQPPFQSEAKLFIRYVSDSRTLNPSENNSRVTSLIDIGQSVMNSEMEILSTFDLAAQVATNLGPEKILAKLGGGNDPVRAAFVIHNNLKVEASRDSSSVIRLTFQHPDPDLVRPVLDGVIAEYLDRHVEIHKAIGLSDDTLTEETTQLRLQIAQTEAELLMAKTNAGIISIADSDKSYQEEFSRIRRELFQAEANLAEHQTSLNEQTQKQATKNSGTNAVAAAIPPETVAQYRAICSQLAFLDKRQDDYLLQQGFTEENRLVKEVRNKILEVNKTKLDLENKNPGLADLELALPPAGTGAAEPESGSQAGQLSSLPLRVKALRAQLAEIQTEAARLGEAEAKIADLERKKKIQEGNYTYFATSLEQARIDEQLGPGRVSNIKPIQTPTPPYKDFSKFHKDLLSLALGGLLAGLAWAFLIEFFLDRSIKRPVDIHTKLGIPFFLSIPDLSQGNRLQAAEKRLLANGAGAASLAAAVGVTPPVVAGELDVSSPVNHALHSHYDALRDRLVNYFESINLTRKPKLVAVTSTDSGAGVSTIAAGLAASLSETGDGRVLLVDMNQENGAAQQFVRGQANCKLDDALISEKRDSALVQENLYVVTEGSIADKLPRILPKRFASLVPKLKASDYDYIIFDMPPVTQTSVTTRLAGFMDTVMLVIESEKTDREVVQQANALLLQSKANVSAVLNKTRKYVPARLQHDINAGV